LLAEDATRFVDVEKEIFADPLPTAVVIDKEDFVIDPTAGTVTYAGMVSLLV